MKSQIKSLFFILSGLLLFSACDKDSKDGEVEIVFEHYFKENAFRVDTTTVHQLDNGEELIFSRFQYYISNIAFQKEDGTWWEEPESYHIVNARQDKPSIKIKPVKEGSYSAIRYIIGVDSIRNFSGAQEGALSPSNEMFWSWNTGYIFLMSEGICLQRPQENQGFIHHVGGFQGANKAIQQNSHAFGNDLVSRGDLKSKVTLRVDVHKLYEGPGINLSIVDLPAAHSISENTRRLSENYANMISSPVVSN